MLTCCTLFFLSFVLFGHVSSVGILRFHAVGHAVCVLIAVDAV